MQNDYVCHYGTKGMKWGHRKQIVFLDWAT